MLRRGRSHRSWPSHKIWRVCQVQHSSSCSQLACKKNLVSLAAAKRGQELEVSHVKFMP